MTDQPQASEPTADPAVSVVGPGDGETIVLGTTRLRVLEDLGDMIAGGRTTTPQADIQAMRRYATRGWTP